MKSKRGDEADHASWNAHRGFGENVMRINCCIRELINPTAKTHDNPGTFQTRNGRRRDPLCPELGQADHSALLKQAYRSILLTV